MKQKIYLDNAATTQVDERVVLSMLLVIRKNTAMHQVCIPMVPVLRKYWTNQEENLPLSSELNLVK